MRILGGICYRKGDLSFLLVSMNYFMTSLTFYGGVNELGGNKILLEDKDTKVFLDFGMSFGKRGAYFDEFMSPRIATGLKDLKSVQNCQDDLEQMICQTPHVFPRALRIKHLHY